MGIYGGLKYICSGLEHVGWYVLASLLGHKTSKPEGQAVGLVVSVTPSMAAVNWQPWGWMPGANLVPQASVCFVVCCVVHCTGSCGWYNHPVGAPGHGFLVSVGWQV
jgi:hypothetical protein